jgi:dolichol-phosphate mannosyltransferase
VGIVGVGVHLVILAVLLRGFSMHFLQGQVIAASAVMVMNYAMNNVLSYRDRRRRGVRFWTGLAGFCVACSLGLVANVSIAHEAFQHGVWWPLAAVIGLLFGVVWNYGVTSIITWRGDRRRIEQTAHRRLAASDPLCSTADEI